MNITDKQMEVLVCIDSRLAKEGQLPTYSQLSKDLGIYPNAVGLRIEALIKKGLLENNGRPQRAIQLTEKGKELI